MWEMQACNAPSFPRVKEEYNEVLRENRKRKPDVQIKQIIIKMCKAHSLLQLHCSLDRTVSMLQNRPVIKVLRFDVAFSTLTTLV